MSEVNGLQWGVYVGGDLIAAFRDAGLAHSVARCYYLKSDYEVKMIEEPTIEVVAAEYPQQTASGPRIVTNMLIPDGYIVAVDGNQVMVIDMDGNARRIKNEQTTQQ